MLEILPDSILSMIYPQACDVCDREVESYREGVACSECWAATRIFNGNETLCTKCGAFLFAAGTPNETFCRRCDAHLFDRALAVGMYEKALSASVLRLKREPRIPRILREMIVDRLLTISHDDDSIVIPVPLSARRKRERGFNQAAMIAQLAAKALRLPVDEATLVRSKHTQVSRAGMDRKARASTVKNAFEVVRPKLVDGRSVLLVDDVLTSGATVSMCASVLKKSGAAKVIVMTIARAA